MPDDTNHGLPRKRACACGFCLAAAKYSETHDAYYCATCDLWLESVCFDDNCAFCNTRPKKPSEVITRQ